MDEEFNIFIVYIAALKAPLVKIIIYPLRKACIIALKQKKALTIVSIKYSDFLDFYSEKKALVLLKWIDLNKYIIKLEDDKQPL